MIRVAGSGSKASAKIARHFAACNSFGSPRGSITSVLAGSSLPAHMHHLQRKTSWLCGATGLEASARGLLGVGLFLAGAFWLGAGLACASDSDLAPWRGA